MKKAIIYIVLVFFVLVSCDDINLKEADYDLPVVEGYISPGTGVEVKITRQMVYVSGDSIEQPIAGLEVQISDDENWYVLNNENDSMYVNETLVVGEGKTYTLQFEYHGKVISAVTTIPSKPQNLRITDTLIDVVPMGQMEPGERDSMELDTLSWTNPENDYYILVVENIEPSPYLINSSGRGPKRIFRNEPVNTNMLEINPMSLYYYGRHNFILYRINAEYASLYQQLSNTSQDLTSPPSNITNGLGIFTGVSSDTVKVTVY